MSQTTATTTTTNGAKPRRERIVGIVPLEHKLKLDAYLDKHGTTYCHLVRTWVKDFIEQHGL